MKRLKAMSNREWVQRHKPDKISRWLNGAVVGCPKDLGLDNNCLQFDCCAICWGSPAKRNGKYIMKVVKENKNATDCAHKQNAELIAKILNDDENGVSSVYKAYERYKGVDVV